MSAANRRSRPRNSSRTKIDTDKINELLSKLQQVVPELRSRRSCTNKALTSKVLQETCDYIRYLQREVHDLSNQLLQLLDTADIDTNQAAIIRHLIA
ncbi:hypothetical protein MLD38_007426 [Melastoma candidum]|uniref:Uncharacterized protein n=1 Tax=Melastoma candidum TaxID=119954 RepID=A0ACB9RSB5_9MYRT|nr:hypothetical protein MLD38_007426 [Melastoma candidum]